MHMKGLPAWQYPLALPACAIERNLFPPRRIYIFLNLCAARGASPGRAGAGGARRACACWRAAPRPVPACCPSRGVGGSPFLAFHSKHSREPSVHCPLSRWPAVTSRIRNVAATATPWRAPKRCRHGATPRRLYPDGLLSAAATYPCDCALGPAAPHTSEPVCLSETVISGAAYAARARGFKRAVAQGLDWHPWPGRAPHSTALSPLPLIFHTNLKSPCVEPARGETT